MAVAPSRGDRCCHRSCPWIATPGTGRTGLRRCSVGYGLRRDRILVRAGRCQQIAERARRTGSRWIDGHPLVHWAQGGSTALANLVLLCYRHHWMVHEGGWQVVRTEHQQVLAISPFTPIAPDPRPLRCPDDLGLGAVAAMRAFATRSGAAYP